MSKKILQNLSGDYNRYTMHFRSYSTRNDWKKLRPMILKRIENREKDYPVQNMVPIANEVLKARMLLIQGISTLIQTIPILSCKFCPEVYIGEKGHLIQTCWGYRRGPKNRVHQWNAGSLDDILVPVETFHLNNMFQKVIKHDQRFDFDRVPAVVELCRQAGADLSMENGYSGTTVFTVNDEAEMLSGDLNFVANGTLRAWETLRSGVKKLLFVYPSKVCKYCSEIHVGPSGHKARLCGIFKYENWRGSHFWRKAGVDDLVPPKIVWRQRPQDPSVLLDKGRDFYGHAPAVVDLCTKAGAIAPTKYHTMMKIHGLPGPV
ncbi:APO protein 4, mitochondrial isoform X1 [Euphorbia lathyris]|uniref:APO protein 4, mitochondrial isoform X1 n=1 Tax=Euphorbia lathyris TaxID=212925 RepID=UPI0033136009